ncbi:hypothetical protein C362_00596 [Cryptococcus neoformans Bt1]|nr:hypothetical protein C362_00596 [Cryptococcus neoformans var. grubii Bt1]
MIEGKKKKGKRVKDQWRVAESIKKGETGGENKKG